MWTTDGAEGEVTSRGSQCPPAEVIWLTSKGFFGRCAGGGYEAVAAGEDKLCQGGSEAGRTASDEPYGTRGGWDGGSHIRSMF